MGYVIPKVARAPNRLSCTIICQHGETGELRSGWNLEIIVHEAKCENKHVQEYEDANESAKGVRTRPSSSSSGAGCNAQSPVSLIDHPVVK